MKKPLVITIIQLGSLLLAASVSAQTAPEDVTFQVPLELTRLSPNITRVAVTCKVGDRSMSNTYSNRVELPVSGGQVVTTASLVVAVTRPQAFKPKQDVSYQCDIAGLISDPAGGVARSGGWQAFDSKMAAAFRVTPVLTPITGTFPW